MLIFVSETAQHDIALGIAIAVGKAFSQKLASVPCTYEVFEINMVCKSAAVNPY